MATSRKRPAFDNPAGLAEAEVAYLFEKHFADAQQRYEARTAAPDLSYVDFLRWCLAHWPKVPLDWLISFLSLCHDEHHEALPHAAMVDIFARLDLRPDPEHPGRLLDLQEDRLSSWLLPWFVADFAPFRAVYRERLAQGAWHPDACHVLRMVDWLLGEEVSADEAAAIGRYCAEQHDLSFNFTPRHESELRPLLRRAGLADAEPRTIGVALLGLDGWRAELEARRVCDPEWSLERYVELIEPLPLAEAVPRLLEGDRPRSPRLTQALVDQARRRPEPPAALLQVAWELAERPERSPLAEILCLEAARRWLDAGEAVPEDVDALLNLDLPHRAPLPLYRAVLPRLPRARRLALLERDLAASGCRGISITALTEDEIVADGPLWRRMLAHSRFDPVAAGQLGERAARLFEALLGGQVEASLRRRLEHALLEAAAVHVAAGGAFDEGWAFYLVLAPVTSEAAEALYAHLPEPLRSDLLLETVREQQTPSDVLGLVRRHGLREEVIDPFVAAYRAREPGAYWYALPGRLAVLNTPGKPPDTFTPVIERLRALAARGPDPREPIYVLQFLPEQGAGRATSWTLLGGPAPVPQRGRSRHLLTVDLRDAPELGSRFPGARAASFHGPRDPDPDADPPESYFWRAHGEAELAPALAALGKRPRRLILHRCEVPVATFGPDPDPDLVAALVRLPGYLLGGPLTIQQDTAHRGPEFVAQLGDDELDLPLGDEGQLYSYVDHATWDCH